MIQSKKFLDLPIIYPVLIVIYPSLALWVSNFDKVEPLDVIHPLLVAIISLVIIFIIFRLVLRDSQKTAFLCSLFFLLYFSYGHLYILIDNKAIFGFIIGRHRYLLALWLVLFVVGCWAIIKYGSRLGGLNRLLNLIGLFLVMITAGRIAYLQLRANSLLANSREAAQKAQSSKPQLQVTNVENLPDIYYIILDSYTRDDVLRQDFNYDNRPFLKQLNDLGFVIPACARSNYPSTHTSMPAAFNMDYLNTFTLDVNDDEEGFTLSDEYVSNSQVRNYLHELGYKIVSVRSGYHWVEIRDADVFIEENSSRFHDMIFGASEFNDMLTQTTIWGAALQLEKTSTSVKGVVFTIQNIQAGLLGLINKPFSSTDRDKYNNIKFALDHVKDVVNLPGKKFLYLHILAPHSPFVFGPDGEFLPSDSPNASYINEIPYLNKRMIELVKMIQSESKIPPVIIIQGDHGRGDDPNTRTDILNAYYLPRGGSKLVYPQITPVNTFRIIFNYYFGGKFKLLPDVSYYPITSNKTFRALPPSCSDTDFTP
jgi:hypothetical protein